MNTLHRIGLVAALCAAQLLGATAAHAAGPAAAAAPAASAAEPVHTRAVVRRIFEEDGGSRLYIALKIVPNAKLPFSTITHRVLDRGLLEGLKEGDSVAFLARRIDGENVVVAIRAAPPCQRFEHCR